MIVILTYNILAPLLRGEIGNIKVNATNTTKLVKCVWLLIAKVRA